MKATCDRKKLLRAFTIAASAVPSRTPKEVLLNVLMNITAEGVELIGTDMERGIRVRSVDGFDVEQVGQVLLNKARFGSILSCGDSDAMRLWTTGNELLVHCNRSKYKLLLADANEYPVIDGALSGPHYEIQASALCAMLRRTVYAVGDDGRLILSGVCLEFGAKGITAVAADGRRLSHQHCGATGVNLDPLEPIGAGQVLLPAETAKLIAHTLNDSEEVARVCVRDNDLICQCGDIDIYSRLMQGRFPNWRKFALGTEGFVRFQMPAGVLKSAVRQAAVVCDAHGTAMNVPSCKITVGGGEMTLDASSSCVGESAVSVPISACRDATVRVNLSYVLDFLSPLQSDDVVEVFMKDESSAMILSTTDGYGGFISPLELTQDVSAQ